MADVLVVVFLLALLAPVLLAAATWANSDPCDYVDLHGYWCRRRQGHSGAHWLVVNWWHH